MGVRGINNNKLYGHTFVVLNVAGDLNIPYVKQLWNYNTQEWCLWLAYSIDGGYGMKKMQNVSYRVGFRKKAKKQSIKGKSIKNYIRSDDTNA